MSSAAVIDSFQGEYRFLSNFELSPISVRVGKQDIQASTVEHAYQALKTTNADDRIRILSARTPGGAKRMGRDVKCRPDWDEVKLRFMRDLVFAKFEQNPRLRKFLLATGDAKLVEGNWWGDRFWGVCRGEGRNNLGKLLMWTRARMRHKYPEEVKVSEQHLPSEWKPELGDDAEEHLESLRAEVEPKIQEVVDSGEWAVLDRYLHEVGIYSFPWQWIQHPLYRDVCLLPGVEEEIIHRMEMGDIHWPFFTILRRLTNYDPTKEAHTQVGGFVATDVRKAAELWVTWYRNRQDPNYWSKLSDVASEQEAAEEGDESKVDTGSAE